MASLADTPTERLVIESRRLRDYLIRTGAKAGQKMVIAVAPFERGGDAPPSPDDIQKLYGAFQAAHEEAVRTIDRYTISEVINGRSPYDPLGLRAFIGAGALTLFGTVLVVLALFYSFWANGAANTLVRAERFAEFDHFGEVMQLVEFEKFFEKTPEGQEAQDLEPFVMYLEEIGSLRTHYADEQNLAADIAHFDRRDNPLAYVRDVIRTEVCPDPLSDGAPAPMIAWFCPGKPDWWTEPDTDPQHDGEPGSAGPREADRADGEGTEATVSEAVVGIEQTSTR